MTTTATIVIALTSLIVRQSHGFLPSPIAVGEQPAPTNLHLVPISRFRDDLTFFEDESRRLCISQDGTFQNGEGEEESSYELCLAEQADLPDLSRFVVGAFGADQIRLSQDLSAFERMLMQPAAELLNGYSGIIAFAEVLSGLNQRLKHRIQNTMDISAPSIHGLSRSEKIAAASKESIVLALARSLPGEDWHVDVIASVELRLEVCDAKIPFTLPWLDRIERRIASLFGLGKNMAGDLKPYLSTLCVDERFRGKGVGRALVHCVEDIVQEQWGYSRIYLHVDPDNAPAYELYKSEGYVDVGKRWNPFWAGNAANIGYFVKNLDRKPKALSAKKRSEATPLTQHRNQ